MPTPRSDKQVLSGERPKQDTGKVHARNSGQPTPAPTSALTGTEPPSTNAPMRIGMLFGDFELVQELGRGGMGIVYKARQRSLERMVAVKMLLTEHAHSDVVVSRFLTEARAAASLDHPNIVKVFQVGESAGGHYFVMEFIDGPPLESLVDNGPMPITGAVAVMIAISDAVHYAHTRGIIHRDLKPSNIMLDRSRRPVVMDFGVAKFVGKSSSLTQQGAILGTPNFMPPEQAGEDLAEVGPHSDVYSLGAILFNLLTGRPPFREETALKTVLKVISAELPPPVRSLRPDAPAKLERICMKCLQKKPSDRYPTARALLEDLRRFRAEHAAAKKNPTAASPAPPLLILVERSTGKKLSVRQETTVIGRAADCDLVIKATDVSKRHCRLLVRDGQVSIEDLSSINGTSVNDKPIQRCQIKNGDKIDIAGHVFEVQFGKSSEEASRRP